MYNIVAHSAMIYIFGIVAGGRRYVGDMGHDNILRRAVSRSPGQEVHTSHYHGNRRGRYTFNKLSLNMFYFSVHVIRKSIWKKFNNIIHAPYHLKYM